ncbi:hypothetical protein DER44DRAFT_190470 [Fusarium oxysporum]|nr:hypothetical protein DER44DRAFT_190470 [Fusarium oxysporum]
MCSTGIPSDGVPGLERPLTEVDLRRGRIKHNRLPKDSEMQPIKKEHVEFLNQLIEDHQGRGILGLHVPHKHFDVPSETHLTGRLYALDGRKYYLTRTINNDEFDSRKLCGHIFIFDQDEGLCPYDFHEAPLPDISVMNRALFSEMDNYIHKHGLRHSVALEYIIPQLPARPMFELVLRDQRCMLLIEYEIVVLGPQKPVVTGYRHVEPGVSLGEGTQYIPLPGGGHKIYNPDERLEIEGVIDVFKSRGVLSI